MREADAPSTEEATLAHRVGARPTGGSHTRTTRGPAQRRGGRKAKAALSNRGGLEQRGKQHTHYKGREALKHNSEPGHLGSCMAYRGGAMKLSEKGYERRSEHGFGR